MLAISELKNRFTNEQVLIILITRMYFGTQDDQTVRHFAATNPIDWQAWYQLIAVNQIRNFIFNTINHTNIPIDPLIYDTLKKDFLGWTMFSDRQTEVLQEVLQLCEQAGIRAIPHKGRTLAQKYYRSSDFREGADVDLLIDKKDFRLLMKLLLDNGYRLYYEIKEHQLGFVLRFMRELAFRSPENRWGISCNVELKWKLVEDFWGKFQGHAYFASHLQRYVADDGTLLAELPPTYDFLCVSVHHLVRESLLKFKYLVDLACIAQAAPGEMDWAEIQAQYAAHGFAPHLWSGINAMQEIIGLSVPVAGVPATHYRLFAKTGNRNRSVLMNKIAHANAKVALRARIRTNLRGGLQLFVPNLQDIALSNGPAWTIPFLVVKKIYRFISGSSGSSSSHHKFVKRIQDGSGRKNP